MSKKLPELNRKLKHHPRFLQIFKTQIIERVGLDENRLRCLPHLFSTLYFTLKIYFIFYVIYIIYIISSNIFMFQDNQSSAKLETKQN